jgi:titin
VVLQCEISKADAPVKWFKDGKEIKPSKNAVIKADGKKRMLILKKALKSDIGQYTCDCGTDQTSAKLDIEGKEISMTFTLEATRCYFCLRLTTMLTLHFSRSGN